MTTSNKALSQPANGSAAWDVPLNANFGIIDAALGSTTSINITGISTTPVTLTATQYQSLSINFTNTLSNNVQYNLPSGVGGQWTIYNNTTGAYSVTVGSLGGGTSIAITQGTRAILNCDGTNVFYADDSRTPPGGSNGSVQYKNGTSFAGSSNLTFDGSNLTLAGTLYMTGADIALPNTRFIYQKNSGGNYFSVAQVDASNNLNIGSQGFAGQITFSNNGALRAYIDTAGKFNVAAPGFCSNSKFTFSHDGSNAAIANTTGNMLFYNVAGSPYIWHINNTQLAVLDVNGNYNVGTGDQSGSGLYNCVSTTGYFTRTGTGGGFDGNTFNISWGGAAATLWIGNSSIGTINTTSDRRIKENIFPVARGALDKIMALRPITYTHRNVGIWRPSGEKVGFIADEVSALMPQAVTGAPDAVDVNGDIAPQNIDPIAILAITVKALQELKTEFDAYKAARP